MTAFFFSGPAMMRSRASAISSLEISCRGEREVRYQLTNTEMSVD
jgi:hypothetical protein